MEQVHGVDVRWMTQGSFKDKTSGPSHNRQPSNERQASRPSPTTTTTSTTTTTTAATTTSTSTPPAAATTSSKRPTPPDQSEAPASASRSSPGVSTTSLARPSRPDTVDNKGALPIPTASPSTSSSSTGSSPAPPQHRRGSWFSNISAKFSSSPSSSQTANAPPRQQQQQSLSPGHQPSPGQYLTPLTALTGSDAALAQPDFVVPRNPVSRNAVLQHAFIPEGDGPYTPAPPKSGQAGFLGGVFRRLSSTGVSNTPNGKLAHGLVERKVLNVDRNRERCPISELKDNKLRRVSFCVDVEIAPMPRYTETAPAATSTKAAFDHAQKKMTERGEGEALKHPRAAEAQKELHAGKTSSEALTKIDSRSSENGHQQRKSEGPDRSTSSPPKETTTRKKEKKKKSEEERKARKEKRRRLAEANGSIPIEIQYDESDSSDAPSSAGSPRSTCCFPTTNPVRIYRRCCQLRESPILKRITEQLNDGANTSATTGFVNKLDLTGYFMQLQDLVTLGDWFAVVPVREVVLDGCGLTDEGLRVILAGLLAAKQPDLGRRRHRSSGSAEHQAVEGREGGGSGSGGVIERLSIKENSLGTDGWKHIALFIYMSKSLKQLDVSNIPFPPESALLRLRNMAPGMQHHHHHHPSGIAGILARSFAERPAGSALEMVNLGGTEPSPEQFGAIVDGLVRCGVSRLGVANNHLDGQGLQHVARYLEAGKCEGLDLGGNDLRDHVDVLAAAIKESHPLWAISLASCNLVPASLCQMLPVFARLPNFRFIDLSHNRHLFDSKPSAVGVLRRYLPKMDNLKRIHLLDVNMTAEQAIAIVEVVPEVRDLAHINLLKNPELERLADAKTEEAKEEACALYASLMAASRISKSVMCVDIDVPSAEASEIVKAMAKQVVAYCLRNMEQLHSADVSPAAVAAAGAEAHPDLRGEAGRDGSKAPAYPTVIAHLVGQDALEEDDAAAGDGAGDAEEEEADEDYVIGGSGVVKALTFCLANRGEGAADVEVDSQGLRLPTGGKAKDLSKHLLAGARKIRLRLQPALHKAKANPVDEITLRRLIFLDETLQGIIKRFEDEFPETREPEASAATEDVTGAHPHAEAAEEPVVGDLERTSTATTTTEEAEVEGEAEAEAEAEAQGEGEAEAEAADVDDETKIHVPNKRLSRSNSELSKVLDEEEGRVHRAGHRFRVGVAETTLTDTDKTDADADDAAARLFDDIVDDPNHVRILGDLADEIGGELLQRVREKGVVRGFREHPELTVRGIKESDLEYWPRFVEAQRKARANMSAGMSVETRSVEGSAVED